MNNFNRNVSLLNYLLTELSPFSRATSCVATQERPSILWNPKVQYRVHKSPPPVPILSYNIMHSNMMADVVNTKQASRAVDKRRKMEMTTDRGPTAARVPKLSTRLSTTHDPK
jgi:hypothetical protein